MDQLFTLYKRLLLNHIKTKTICPLFHSKSEEFYSLWFDVFHELSEKRQDLWLDSTADEESVYQDTYDIMMQIKTMLEGMVKEKNSVGMDNLLRGLIDKVEFSCGNAKAFVKGEEDEYEYTEEGKKDVEKWLKPKK